VVRYLENRQASWLNHTRSGWLEVAQLKAVGHNHGLDSLKDQALAAMSSPEHEVEPSTVIAQLKKLTESRLYQFVDPKVRGPISTVISTVTTIVGGEPFKPANFQLPEPFRSKCMDRFALLYKVEVADGQNKKVLWGRSAIEATLAKCEDLARHKKAISLQDPNDLATFDWLLEPPEREKRTRYRRNALDALKDDAKQGNLKSMLVKHDEPAGKKQKTSSAAAGSSSSAAASSSASGSGIISGSAVFFARATPKAKSKAS